MHHYVKLNRTEAGYFVETWYFRQHRSYVTQLLTDNYDQLGEAVYSSTRAGAEKAHQEALDGVLEALPPNVPPMILRKLA